MTVLQDSRLSFLPAHPWQKIRFYTSWLKNVELSKSVKKRNQNLYIFSLPGPTYCYFLRSILHVFYIFYFCI